MKESSRLLLLFIWNILFGLSIPLETAAEAEQVRQDLVGAAAARAGGGGHHLHHDHAGATRQNNHPHSLPPAPWLVNGPADFWDESVHMGQLLDVRADKGNMSLFVEMCDYHLARTDAFTDGEVVDAAEHFFWGMRNGLAIELGALDGSPNSRSMTFEYEKSLGWKRILVEGNPHYTNGLKTLSPLAFGVVAAICEHQGSVHFSPKEYVGGIIEFMGLDFLKSYHPKIYEAGVPPGNISSINWETVKDQVTSIDCIPLGIILRRARAKHVNYFILDVEGGELEVLRSINWAYTKFDVLCIETEANNRPPGFADNIISYLAERGYRNVTGQQGRNTWFTHVDFVPSPRPGLDPQCFNGARKSMREDAWWLNRRTPKFERCPMQS